MLRSRYRLGKPRMLTASGSDSILPEYESLEVNQHSKEPASVARDGEMPEKDDGHPARVDLQLGLRYRHASSP
jgi:hypothetical protein